MTHMLRRHMPLLLRLVPLAFLLTACGQPAPPPGVKVGKPYTVNGTTYFPKIDNSYDKVGEASWYGPGFHGKMTASGETFDQNEMTAAHPTLPMPSIVRVTNLKNGKSALIRINDRGPFKSNRIIDLSKKSAQTLGIHSLAQVRVQVLKEETEAYIAHLKNGGSRRTDLTDLALSEEPQEEEESQVVENTDSTTYKGQAVSDAAPVMSVGSGDLASSDLPPLKKEDADNNRTSAANAAPPSSSPPSPRYVRDELGKPMNAKQSAEERPDPRDSPTEEVAEAKPSAGRAPEEVHIQVGAFSSEENARKLNVSLSSISAVSIAKIKAAGQELWRVRLGPFSSRSAALSALDKVRAAGAPDARIIE